jgi:hypothetical protein
MEIVWVLAILAVLVSAAICMSHRRADLGDLPATNSDNERRAEKARRRSASGAYSGSWGFFGGGDGGGGFGGGFDGGGCGGDGGGGGGSC